MPALFAHIRAVCAVLVPLQVDAVLKKYIAAVTALYDNHKATFGYDDKETLLIK